MRRGSLEGDATGGVVRSTPSAKDPIGVGSTGRPRAGGHCAGPLTCPDSSVPLFNVVSATVVAPASGSRTERTIWAPRIYTGRIGTGG